MSAILGGCACRAVRYESDGEPVAMVNCHCRDCQRATGSAFAAIMVVPKSSVTIEGQPRYHAVTGASGQPVERGFCVNCGSPVTLKFGYMPGVVGFHAASLDDPGLYKPSVDVFTASAHVWDFMNPDLPKKSASRRG